MKYYIKTEKTLTPVDNILTYGYFLGGFQDQQDKGRLSTMTNIFGGTTLVGVVDCNGEPIINKSLAGYEVKDISIHSVINIVRNGKQIGFYLYRPIVKIKSEYYYCESIKTNTILKAKDVAIHQLILQRKVEKEFYQSLNIYL